MGIKIRIGGYLESYFLRNITLGGYLDSYFLRISHWVGI